MKQRDHIVHFARGTRNAKNRKSARFLRGSIILKGAITTSILLCISSFVWNFQSVLESTSGRKSFVQSKENRGEFHLPSIPYHVVLSPNQNFNPSMPCYEGELKYMHDYPDIEESFNLGKVGSGFHHWSYLGKNVGRKYSCNEEPSADADPSGPCPEGEELYLEWYKDLRDLVPEQFQKGFEHWYSHGKGEGRVYFCKLDFKLTLNSFDVVLSPNQNLNPSMPCYEGELEYMYTYSDIEKLFIREEIRSGFHHWSDLGKNEGRKYSCNEKPSANADPSGPCPEGEELYLEWYRSVRGLVPEYFQKGFEHWNSHGKDEGKFYFCKLK